eukprot:TRINITY_DN2574_c0_g2_i1.p1 TRINITY_DN2574_c0_g2~~TRINITY_DN2574_c0_g2_i1.p1  ORF type:complete len:314 (-),score=38.29 TRINITY_DN2574_c0_g2_i1:1048-1989(-)
MLSMFKKGLGPSPKPSPGPSPMTSPMASPRASSSHSSPKALKRSNSKSKESSTSKDVTVVLPDGLPCILPSSTTLHEVSESFPGFFLSTSRYKADGTGKCLPVLHRELLPGKTYYLHPIAALQLRQLSLQEKPPRGKKAGSLDKRLPPPCPKTLFGRVNNGFSGRDTLTSSSSLGDLHIQPVSMVGSSGELASVLGDETCSNYEFEYDYEGRRTPNDERKIGAGDRLSFSSRSLPEVHLPSQGPNQEHRCQVAPGGTAGTPEMTRSQDWSESSWSMSSDNTSREWRRDESSDETEAGGEGVIVRARELLNLRR